MKKEDIDRLKALCEKEGFEIYSNSASDEIVFVMKKKDPWDGVGFAKVLNCDGGNYSKDRIYPLIGKDKNYVNTLFDDNGNTNNGLLYRSVTPSTEAEYVDQLKKECFERFGEIKEGDRFTDNPTVGTRYFVIDSGIGFSYIKNQDLFTFNGWPLYQSGQWAKKLPERVEVEFIGSEGMSNCSNDDGKYIGGKYKFIFKLKNNEHKNLNYIGKYLASQLEKYLNDEQ